jgi:hypothetical protein
MTDIIIFHHSVVYVYPIIVKCSYLVVKFHLMFILIYLIIIHYVIVMIIIAISSLIFMYLNIILI